MKLDALINEYKTLPRHCENIDYADKKAVRRNNTSVDRMYKIVETIRDKFGKEGIEKLKVLLDIEEHRTNLWIATQLLDRVSLDADTEKKALGIIHRISATDELLKCGYAYWLKDYEKRKRM